MVRNLNQDQADSERVYYTLRFPADLDEKNVQSWLRAISASLRKGGGVFSPVDTLVLETVATARGITHQIGVHHRNANFVIGQLRAHIPGLRAEPLDRRLFNLNYGVEIGMTNPLRLLHIPEAKALSQSLLASVQALQPEEVVVTQWIVTPAKVDTLKRDLNGNVIKDRVHTLEGWLTALSMAPSGEVYRPYASNDEVHERATKLEDANVQAIGRVAAYSPNPTRLGTLVGSVVTALRSARSNTNSFKELGAAFKDVPALARKASTPSKFPAQFNVSELSAVLAWPIGQPHVAGLPQGSSRHLATTEAIPREGCVLGMSNFPGDERPVAIDWLDMMKHLHVMGPTGVGKTTLLANLVHQAMNTGHGVIVMESKGDLFNAALQAVPVGRIKDTIVLDVTDVAQLVGFNVLDQGNPRVVIDQLTSLFQHLYNSNGQDVWFRELMYFGLNTLAEHEGSALTDLAVLVSPNTPEEVAWADEVKKSVKNKDVRDFWELRWNKLEPKERQRNAAPLHNRIWQLVSRPELRNIIGQSKSSFQMDDIIRKNKILLINLTGVPTEAASMAGTLIMNALWTSVQRVKARNPNYLFLDEFQDFMRLPVGAEEMLAKARGFNLSMTLAHQHLAQLTDEVRSAVVANARSKLYFQTSTEDARVVLRSLGTTSVSESDLMQLGMFEGVARIAVGTGSSSPVTLMTSPPLTPEGFAHIVQQSSRRLYARAVTDIEQEIVARRSPSKPGNSKAAPIAFSPAEWGK